MADRMIGRPFLWHAMFDGTVMCWCWHSQEMKARAALREDREHKRDDSA